MKATELRVGNWVSYQGEEYQIHALGSQEANLMDGKGTHPYGLLSGISLTEEWLLRLGFVDGKIIFADEFIEIENLGVDGLCSMNKFIDFGERKVEITTIQSVHQLQNLYYALTGEDLVIR